MSCNTCGGNQTGGIYSKCPDGTQPTYQFLLYDLTVSNTVPAKTIGPYDHATALLELHKFLNPPILRTDPVTYDVVQAQYCGQEEISRSNNFPLSCGGGGGPEYACLPPPTCNLVAWNPVTCQCCKPNYVYCAQTQECVPLPEGCTLERYNPQTCACCPVGYIYCPTTGQCELPENCGGGGSGCPPGSVYCVASGQCVTPENCSPVKYNQATCQCCPPDSVYCIASETCIPREDIPCLLAQWNQLTCQCCPPGYVYCSQTGECVPLPVNCAVVMWNPVTCTCCPPGYVFCEETGACEPLPQDCTIVQYNPVTCECCREGTVFCTLTQVCVPLPPTCTLQQWNPFTCECCPPNSIFNGLTCQTTCDPASFAPVTLDWELLPTGGGIQINNVLGSGGQPATTFTVVILPATGQGVAPVIIQYPTPASPNDPPVTLPISVPLLSGDYNFVVSGIMFGECIYADEVTGTINNVTAGVCCQAIVGIGGGNEVRYFETEIEIPQNAVAPYITFADIYTIVMVDRISAYLDDGAGNWVEVAQSPFIGTTALPTNEYANLAFAQGAENGYWRNANSKGSLVSPYFYAAASGNPAGVEFPNSDFGYNGSANYLTPANRAQFSGTAPANFPFSGFNTGKGRLFLELPNTLNPGDTVTIRYRVEGGKDGTVWYAVPGCLVDGNCANCGEQLPVPDECCPFKLEKDLQEELDQPAGTAISITIPAGLSPVNGVAPYTVSVTFSPGANAGLAFNPATNKITGVLIPGPLNLLLQVTDAQGCTVTQVVNLIIACPSIELRQPGGNAWQTVQIGEVIDPINNPINFAVIGGDAPYTWALAAGSTLPPGLSIVNHPTLPDVGSITGTVGGAPATYAVVIEVTDANGCKATTSFPLTVTN